MLLFTQRHQTDLADRVGNSDHHVKRLCQQVAQGFQMNRDTVADPRRAAACAPLGPVVPAVGVFFVAVPEVANVPPPFNSIPVEFIPPARKVRRVFDGSEGVVALLDDEPPPPTATISS